MVQARDRNRRSKIFGRVLHDDEFVSIIIEGNKNKEREGQKDRGYHLVRK